MDLKGQLHAFLQLITIGNVKKQVIENKSQIEAQLLINKIINKIGKMK